MIYYTYAFIQVDNLYIYIYISTAPLVHISKPLDHFPNIWFLQRVPP